MPILEDMAEAPAWFSCTPMQAPYLTGLCQIEETGNVAVLVNAQLGCSVGTLRVFYTHIFYDDETCAASCAQLIVFDVLITQLSCMPGKVASHGHHDNTVRECHTVDREGAEDVFEVVLHLIYLRLCSFSDKQNFAITTV